MTAPLDVPGLLRDEPEAESYQPGTNWDAISAGQGEAGISKLDSNENPYGPAPLVRKRLAEAALHRYPDMEQRAVRGALADYIGVRPENIVGGNGSDELIDLLTRLVCEPGDRMIIATPTFAMYGIYARQHGVTVDAVPRRGDDWKLDLAAISATVIEQTRVIILATPNNPTGNAIGPAELDQLLALGPLVVLDEAYAEFASPQYAPLAAERPNLAVLRTFSKWAGLAGVRAGYLVAHESLAARVMQMKSPFNMSLPAQIAVVASIEERGWLEANVRRIVEERERLMAELSAFPLMKVWPSEGNFVLCRLKGMSGQAARDALRERGVFTRYFDREPLKDCLRITAGLPEDTDRLLVAIKELWGKA
ncbi:MAG: histidinol-phosphate transaminase [Dehalococcoidia bacterium]